MYAKNTTVSEAKSRMDIEQVIRKYGASQFVSGFTEDAAMIGFTLNGWQVRFILPLDVEPETRTPTGRCRKPDAVEKARDQERRRRWRALFLVIKAKLEVVETGISSFEEEFLAHIVIDGNRTVKGEVLPKLRQLYETGDLPPLLTAGS